MTEGPVGGDRERREVREMLAQYDAPAYARRARRMELALEHLLDRCRQKRGEWLMMPRLRIGQLAALAGEWSALLPVLDQEQIDRLQQLHVELAPKLRLPLTPTTSLSGLRGAVREFILSAERFNRRWNAYLTGVNLDTINELREGYNRYYVLEKECAIRNSVLARLGFHPQTPLTTADLERLLPPLFVPELRRDA
jgi:hypothetical protein